MAWTSRQLQQTVAHSFWWESLSVPTEAGTDVWGRWRPCPPRASQLWRLAFQAGHTSSGGIPGHASPHSCPLCCICTANSAPLPISVLPTPHFSTQPLPASADCCPRQGCPGLIPKEALGWAALRPQNPHGRRRPWPEGQAGPLRWEPLPVPPEAEEAGGWGKGL